MLIGYTGFVGTTLAQQAPFDGRFNRANIGEIDGSATKLLVCSAAPAQKWLANQKPEDDLLNIKLLIKSLAGIEAENAILISTVDVFSHPIGVTEDDEPKFDPANAYGANRRLLEVEFQDRFPNSLVARLPGLVGSGLRKNALFDLKNENEIHKLNGGSIFQFYPMSNLWNDLSLSLKSGLSLVHLTAEPVSIGEIASKVFGKEVQTRDFAARYDFQSKHASLWSPGARYQYHAQESLDAIREYARS